MHVPTPHVTFRACRTTNAPGSSTHEFDGGLRIGLISDTHIPEARRTLWDEVYDSLAGVDLILHAGDMHDVVVLDWLERVAPVIGVRGNGDDGTSGRPVAPNDPRLAYNQVLTVDGLRIGMTHDFPHLDMPRLNPRAADAAAVQRCGARRGGRRHPRPTGADAARRAES